MISAWELEERDSRRRCQENIDEKWWVVEGSEMEGEEQWEFSKDAVWGI